MREVQRLRKERGVKVTLRPMQTCCAGVYVLKTMLAGWGCSSVVALAYHMHSPGFNP